MKWKLPSRPNLVIVTFVFAQLLLFSCGEKEQKPLAPVVQESPAQKRANVFADSVMATLSLDEKVGQLMLLRIPEDEDTTVRRQFVRFLKQYKIGGILLSSGDRDWQKEAVYDCRQGAGLPLWAGLDADDGWAERNKFPQLISLGASGIDTLARDWGLAIGAECRYLGAQLCFISAAKVDPGTDFLPNSLGADPLLVAEMGTVLSRGIAKWNVLPCLQFMPNKHEIPVDSGFDFLQTKLNLQVLRAFELFPIQQIADSAELAIVLGHTIFNQIDSVPASMSARVMKGLLGQGLGFDGLRFTGPFSDSVFVKIAVPGEVEVRSLIAGASMLLDPGNPQAVINEVKRAIEDGEMNGEDLDGRVRDILYLKAMAGLDTLNLQHPDSMPVWRNLGLHALSREISERSLTVVHDETGRIPLGAGVAQSKVATLSLGVKRKTTLQRVVQNYGPIDHFILGPKASKAAYKAQLKRLRRYDYVIVSLHAELSGKDGNLPERTLKFLGELKGKTRLVVANFTSPQSLPNMDSLPCVVQAYDDRDMSREVAGQFIFGGIEAGGTFPAEISGYYCIGDGLPRGRKTRLEYTIPDELGADPLLLERVDSIINTAIWRGTFPGCQVIAAKDGKVFFNKAYGHHDYNRRRRVRLDDLYDIASVTKIVATTLMAMYAWETDSLHLKFPLKYYMDELDSTFISIKNITPEELMIHEAGLPPGLPIYKTLCMIDSVDTLKNLYYSRTKDSIFSTQIAKNLYFNTNYHDTIWNKIRQTRLATRGKYVYSDMSMFLMKALLEHMYDLPLNRFVDSVFYKPLGLQTTCYLPLARFDEKRIVPTEDDRWWRKQELDGYVHDHSTALFGGVGGQAGVFSNARDLATLMQMLLNGGTYGGKRYFRRSTVRKFTSRHPESHRGLGFDKQKPVPIDGKGYCCGSAAPETFGHFGFTGTCAWADPEHQIVYVLLSNRVYPKAKNWKINIYRVRQNVQQALYDALGIGKKLEDPLMMGMQGDSAFTDSSLADTTAFAVGDSLD